MSSANYRIQADSLNNGGGRSTSASFIIEDTIGEFATGEDLSSTNFEACGGYQCFQGAPYISFSVRVGTAAPGTSGVPILLGTLSPTAVTTSDGSTINSIFLTAETNAQGGSQVMVHDQYGGLAKASSPSTKITSSTATLAAGTEGFGVCVFSTGQHIESPSGFNKVAPYNGTCNKTTGHQVGAVSTSAANIITSSAGIKEGTAEVLVKASISNSTPSGSDYEDTITFVYTGTY